MARRVCVLWVVFAAALSSPLPALEFFDDFERPDGMLSEWVEFYPTAEISGGRLSLRASVVNVQPNAWAGVGGEAIFFHDLARVSFGIEFLGTPFDDVGRHGGVLVCGAEPSHRYAVGFSGYFIDWIDRVTDRGFRVFRVDGGAHTLLAQQTDHLDPPEEWTIEFTLAGFRVIADGVPVEYLEPGLGTVGDEGEILDTTYRSGYVGFWCWQNTGQNMLVDDLAITYADNACASLVPWRVRARYEDPSRFISVYIPYGSNAAAPYTVTVTTTDPQVVAFAGAAGDTLDVVFNVGDPQARDIEIVFGDIGTAELRLSVAGTDCPMIVPVEVVPKPTVKFMEDFAGEDGPPTDFYVQSPAVSVEFEELALRATAGVEPHAWAGIAGLPIPCEDIAEIRCNIRFGLNASAPILRHGGVVFCAAAPATRWNNPSYLADYLERDQTFRIVKA